MYYDEKKKRKKTNFWIVFFIILVLILSISGFIVYKKIQAPVQDEIQKYANINFMTFYDDKLVSTGIIVTENGKEIMDTKTSDRGATTVKVFFNNSIVVSTFNLENQSYILDSREFKIDSVKPVQVKFRLDKMAKIDVEPNINRDYIEFTIKNTDVKDFGELILFVKTRGIVIQNSKMDYDMLDYSKAVDVGYDKAYIITKNLEEGRIIKIEVPFVRVSNSFTLDYWFGSIQSSPLIEYQIVGGQGNSIKI